MVKKEVEEPSGVVEWLKQRRVWAAVLSALAVFSVSMGWLPVAELFTSIAGLLSLHSYIRPKEQNDG